MKNKYGREIEVIDCRQLQEAKVRHLKAVRMRYLDYIIQMKEPDDRAICNAILAEKMLKQNERI